MEKYLLDTDVLVSKQFVSIKEPFVVSLISVVELASVIREKYLEKLNKGEKLRAEGYVKFLNLVLSYIRNVVVEVSFKDIEEAINIMFERDVNLGDAVNAMVARRLGCTVISNDKDWDRLEDIVRIKRV
jgi:predicted nucleic acid-binding protein